jgi:sugar phosphate isomerase/epimerase
MSDRRRSISLSNAKSPLPRRDWLKVVGVAFLGSQVCEAATDDLRAKAKKNLVLGIDAGVYRKLPLEEAARRIKEDGFTGVLTNYGFADVRFDPLKPDWSAADKITACFEKHGIRVASLYGYYNVVDPDPERRKRGEARIEFFIANWKRLGCPVIATETGTYNRKSEWLDDPTNFTEAAFVECRASLQRLARLAEKSGATLAIEVYWRHVVGTIDRAERLLREVNSPSLRLVMDPANYLRNEDLPRMQPMLHEMFQRLSDKAVVAHAKDVKAVPGGPEHPAAGKGTLDYPLYLRLLAQLNRKMHLLLEHLTLDDVPRARDYVLSQFDKI